MNGTIKFNEFAGAGVRRAPFGPPSVGFRPDCPPSAPASLSAPLIGSAA